MKFKCSRVLGFLAVFAVLTVFSVFAFRGFTIAGAVEAGAETVVVSDTAATAGEEDTTAEMESAATSDIDAADDETGEAASTEADTQMVEAEETAYTEVASSEILSFLYIDNTEISAGTDQNIVASFNEDLGNLASAKLYLQDSEGEDAGEYEATTLVDSAVLFTFDTSVYGGGEYSVSVIELTTEDGFAYRVTFDDCDVRSFTVSDGVALMSLDDELSEDSSDAAEGTTTAYTLDADGNMVEADSISDALVDAQALTGSRATANSNIIVALDPGHGGDDPGAPGNGLYEKNLTWKIANYCKQELENAYGVTVVLTRSENENPTLATRAKRAADAGAKVCISIHINSGGGKGAEVWVPNSSSYNYETHVVGEQLGKQIVAKLAQLGLVNRGVKTENYPSGYEKSHYSDGSTADYYGLIRESRYLGLTGIIIEHAFIDSSSDAYNFLNSDAKLKALGVADAQGIAQDLNILTGEGYYSPVYDYDYYIANNPDVKAAFNGDKEKTLSHFINYGMKEGRRASANFDVESYYNANGDLRIAFGTNLKSYYTHYIEYGKKEGRTATGVTALQGYRTSINGTDYSAVYDGAYYRSKNGDLDKAFTKTVSDHKLFDDTALLNHFINYGMKEGRTSSASFDLDSYYNANGDLRIAYGTNLKSYYTHYIKYGKKEGRTCTGVTSITDYRSSIGGTDYSAVYDGAYYRSKNGDLDKAYTKTVSGHKLFDDTALLNHLINYGMKEGRLTSANFDLGSYFNANGDLRAAYGFNYKSYYTHYIKYGKKEGRTCKGVSKLDAYTTTYSSVNYSAIYNGEYYYNRYADLQKAYSKTLNGSKLINDAALIKHYVQYGMKEGRIAKQDQEGASETSIMGASKTTVNQMVTYYKRVKGESAYPASVYSSKGAATLKDFCQIVYEEATAEGVRAEVVFCQSILETGWLQFKDSVVKPEQCNFAGLGATGGSVSGAAFSDVRTGIRAQVQHLKAYASTDALNNECVDPRFHLVSRGCAPTLYGLNGRWAVPGTTYGQDIYKLMQALLSY